jgi:hypothetical protein
MCVSAPASFIAGSALAVVGAITIIKARRYDRQMLLFALFPVIFSFHQFIEGFVWLSLGGTFSGTKFIYIYLFIATSLWPSFCPLASLWVEPSRVNQAARYVLFAAGLSLSAYQFFQLATSSGIEVKVVGHSLSYIIGYRSPPPEFINYTYALITVSPLFIVRNQTLDILGILAGAAFLYTLFEMREVWYSVWCFSAAVFSAFLYFSIKGPATKEVSKAAKSVSC